MARLMQFSYMALLALLVLSISIVQSSPASMDDDDASDELLNTRAFHKSLDARDSDLQRDARYSAHEMWTDIQLKWHALLAKIGIKKREQRAEILNQILRVAQSSADARSSSSSEETEDLNQRGYDFSRVLRKKRQALRAH